MSKKDRQFWESAGNNTREFWFYYDNMTELSVSMFDWKNVPKGLNIRFLELTLFTYGKAVLFKDEDLVIPGVHDGFLALPFTGTGVDLYGEPIMVEAYGRNEYRRMLTPDECVIIYNNYTRKPSQPYAELFAKKLYDLGSSTIVNAKAQKTPVLINCSEQQRLTMLNLYKKYEGNEPFIFGDDGLSNEPIKAIATGAPYVADKLNALKRDIFNEYLTYRGISNVNFNKRERLITDEVNKSEGGTKANRACFVQMRKVACEEAHDKFGLNLECDYREEVEEMADSMMKGDGGNESVHD